MVIRKVQKSRPTLSDDVPIRDFHRGNKPAVKERRQNSQHPPAATIPCPGRLGTLTATLNNGRIVVVVVVVALLLMDKDTA